MASNHSHGAAALSEGHQKKLVMALALTGSFMIAEVIGAWITGSLALLSDASHMLTDDCRPDDFVDCASNSQAASRSGNELLAMLAWKF